MSRSVLDGLRRPAPLRKEGVQRWVLGPSVLLPCGLADAFTEHSGRKCLPSLSSTLPGVSREDIDTLGNWSRQRSRGYDAMVGSVVAKLQAALTASRLSFGAHYHERDLGEELVQFLVGRRGTSTEDAKKLVDPVLVESFGGLFTSELRGTSSTSPSAYYQASAIADTSVDLEPDLAAVNALKADYWVSISERTGYRRLHRRGGCWVTAKMTEPVTSLSEASYNSRCGHCWKMDDRSKHKSELRSKINHGTDTSVSTSSESSSSES